MSILSVLTWLSQALGLSSRPFRPRPSDWNKTLEDLSRENRSLSGEEMDWAREYERDLLRASGPFPRDGDEYECLADLEVTFATHWRAPYGRGVKGVLPAGAVLRAVVSEKQPEPIAVELIPRNAAELESLVVPEEDRRHRDYAGFSLTISVAQLRRDFRPLPRGGEPATAPAAAE